MSLLSTTCCRLVVLIVGALFPAYASCKAVQSRNAREYVHWMMYWIVLASLLTLEPIVDSIFARGLPFYNQLKIGVVLWLQSSTSKGASLIFRKAILPQFKRREAEIDVYLDKVKVEAERVGSTTAKYVTHVVVRYVMKHIRENYGITELVVSDMKTISDQSEVSSPRDL
ncbi:receptor expression-enhancing protein 4-like [Ornithodoros turicata]|uniref:receptor expression-enhancing protein 4-like n=1 Tax=Ornithodoros turicata TaxID=34597 RepID=UPI0031389583